MVITRFSTLYLFLLAASAFADIVWKGKRVDQWPSEALPELHSRVLGKTTINENGLGFYPHPTGTIKGLTILVDFSDQASKVAKQDIDDWLNKPGFNKNGCNGSIRDYFYEASHGKVEFQNTIYGFYRAKNTKAYYDEGTDYERASELLNEVLNAIDANVNFADYDNDGDGNTEAISIVYAGAGKTWGKGIWPHSGWVGQKRDGVTLTRYMMTDMPGTFSLYVFAHENSHMVFGWPDLYWFGDYCLLGNRMSDVNPVLINDFFRADQGWISVMDVDSSTNGTFVASYDSMAYRYPNPKNAKEGFFWSNIPNTGRNSSLQGSGLVLYHYNMSLDGNTSASSLLLRIVQADNQAHLQSTQWPNPGNAANDPFRSGTSTEFSVSTSNYNNWYNNTASSLRIWDISSAMKDMTFKLGTGVNLPTPIPRAVISQPRFGVDPHQWNLKGQREGQ